MSMTLVWKMRVLLFCLTLLCSTAPLCAQHQQQEAEIKSRVVDYLTRYFKLSPRDSIVVNQIWSVDNPPLWGLSVTRTQGGKSSDDVYMLSKDMKTLSLGRVLDFTENFDAENMRKVTLDDSPSRGPADAPVTLVEFCDLQCPDCKAMAENLDQALPAYGNKVRVVFKNFPLMSKHHWAEAAAIGARCAYVQKPQAFWNFYDFFYAQQESVNSQNIREKILQVGRQAGLNEHKLVTCIDTKATLPAIQADLYEAAKLGVRGTPTLLVNGRFVFNEEMTANDYRKLIDEALGETKK